MEELVLLHKRTKSRNLNYDQRQKAYRDYQNYSEAICSRLPFEYKMLGAENVWNNHNGSNYGCMHIVLTQDFLQGRIKRIAGETLCKTKGFLSIEPSSYSFVDCKSCLEKAVKLSANQT